MNPSLIPHTEAGDIAAEIDRNQTDAFIYLERLAINMHSKFHTQGLTQEILDTFGTNGTEIISRYGKLRDFIIDLFPESAANIPAPDPTQFTFNPDGSVTLNQV